MGRTCSSRGGEEEEEEENKKKNAYSVFVGEPGGKKPPVTPRRGWEDNIKIDLRNIGWGDMDEY
jgi:hypothetical protein